jgi:hypothetical protein
MNVNWLDFAIALACNESGCQVRPIGSQETLAASYAPEVLNKVKIRPGQLVAINRQAETPEIVWRWYCTVVTTPGQDELIVDDRGCRQLLARRAPGFEADLAEGEKVWVGGQGGGSWEALDRVSPEGELSQPERSREYAFESIQKYYQAERP